MDGQEPPGLSSTKAHMDEFISFRESRRKTVAASAACGTLDNWRNSDRKNSGWRRSHRRSLLEISTSNGSGSSTRESKKATSPRWASGCSSTAIALTFTNIDPRRSGTGIMPEIFLLGSRPFRFAAAPASRRDLNGSWRRMKVKSSVRAPTPSGPRMSKRTCSLTNRMADPFR